MSQSINQFLDRIAESFKVDPPFGETSKEYVVNHIARSQDKEKWGITEENEETQFAGNFIQAGL